MNLRELIKEMAASSGSSTPGSGPGGTPTSPPSTPVPTLASTARVGSTPPGGGQGLSGQGTLKSTGVFIGHETPQEKHDYTAKSFIGKGIEWTKPTGTVSSDEKVYKETELETPGEHHTVGHEGEGVTEDAEASSTVSGDIATVAYPLFVTGRNKNAKRRAARRAVGQRVAEGFFDQFRKKQQNYGGIDVSVEKEDNNILVKATANGRELGRVLFTPSEQDDNLLVPLDLEVDERYRGQGIGATMYDYVKSLGYTIRRSQYQTDAGAGFWDKHKSGKNVWEEGDLDRFKKYTRPVVKTTPKIEKTTNPSGRTTDHVEWKVTTPTGEIHRYKSKKQAQEHYDSFGQQGVAEGSSYKIDQDDHDEFTPDEIVRIKNSHFPDTLRDNLRTAKKEARRAKHFPSSSDGGDSKLGSPVGSASDNTYEGVAEGYDEWNARELEKSRTRHPDGTGSTPSKTLAKLMRIPGFSKVSPAEQQRVAKAVDRYLARDMSFDQALVLAQKKGVAEGSGLNVVKSIKVGNFRHDLVNTGMGWQVRIYNGDELHDTGLSKNSEQKGLAALEDAVAYTEKQTRTKRQGVAEGFDEAHVVGNDSVIYRLDRDNPMSDTEVAVLGGAGRYSLKALRDKARREAAELAQDLSIEHGGAFRRSATNIKQLTNTINTIVAAYNELARLRRKGGRGSRGITDEDANFIRECIRVVEQAAQNYRLMENLTIGNSQNKRIKK